MNHFTNGGYIPGIEMEYTLLNQIAQNIPVEQVNQYIQDMIGELDFGCLVVHVFTEETRAFYDLERLWNDATPVPIDFAE